MNQARLIACYLALTTCAVSEAAGVVLHSYIAPVEGHGILKFETSFEMEVKGVKLTDWIRALLDNKPLADVG